MTLHTHKEIITTEWYSKPTSSGRYLHYTSIHPQQHKNSVITALADRSIALSHPSHREKQIKRAKRILLENGYPEREINKIFKRRIHKFYNNYASESKSKSKEEKTYIAIPYIQGLSEKIANILQKHDITTTYKTANNLQNLYTNLKTPTPKESKTNLIYSIPCKNCNGVYIGQTKQYLKNRIKGHESNLRGNNADKTALSKHAMEEGHSFDFANTRILKTEKHLRKRTFLEMVYIKRNKTAINYRTDTNNLSQVYTKLLQ